MNISTVISAVLRRWYVSVLVLALTGFYAQQLWESAEPTYTSSSTIAVLPSQSLMDVRERANAGESSLGNPFGASATGVLAALLADSIGSGQLELPPAAAGTRVAVEASTQRAESFFTVVATGPTQSAPGAALDAVAEQSPGILAEMQTRAGSPADQLYTSQEVVPHLMASASYPDRQRAVVGVLLVGLLAAALLSVLVDSLVKTLRTRRRAAARPAPTAVATPTVVTIDQPRAERRTSERRSAAAGDDALSQHRPVRGRREDEGPGAARSGR